MLRSRFRAAAVVVAGLVAVAGCSGGEPVATPVTTAPSVVIPDTATGRATQWVLDQLGVASGPNEAEAAEVFAPVFLDQIPAAQVEDVFDQLRDYGPFEVTGYGELATSAEAELTGAGGDRFILSVSTDADELIQGLFLRPAPVLPDVASAQEAADAVVAAAEEASFLLARIEADEVCTPVHAREEDVLRPTGSVFKLYVLGAVVDAVAAGDLAWDSELTLTDDLRSLPSGTLQEEPAGTRVSVLDAARGMIAISDNTATDLLIDAVGRDAVEAAVERMGHSEPEVLRPLLSTRELFQLSFVSADGRQQWRDATGADPLSPDPAVSDRQRALVDGLPGGEIVIDESLVVEPAWADGLEWFATAEDVCAAHVALHQLAATEAGAPVAEILSANPGLSDAEAYDYVAFKGGSSPGVIAGSWTVEVDGEAHVLVVTMASTTAPVPDPSWMVAVAEQTLATIGE